MTKKKRRRNPFEPGLSKYWYLRGRVAAKKSYEDMYAGWRAAKAKPITPGAKVTAQESFFRGFMDKREESPRKNPLPIGKWFKAKIQKLRSGKFKVEIPDGLKLPYDMTSKRR